MEVYVNCPQKIKYQLFEIMYVTSTFKESSSLKVELLSVNDWLMYLLPSDWADGEEKNNAEEVLSYIAQYEQMDLRTKTT